MATAIDVAGKALTDRLGELEAEAKRIATEERQVRKALEALRVKPSPRARPSGGKRGSASAKDRAPRGQRREQVLTYLKDNAPARPIDIAGGINVSANQVHGLLSKLRTEKLVKKTAKGYGLTASASD